MDDIARFEMFCKLRTEIRGSDNHLIVGIDIAKDKHHAFYGTPQRPVTVAAPDFYQRSDRI